MGTFAALQTITRFEGFCWSSTSGEGNSGLEFPPFVLDLSDCGLAESKHFRDVFSFYLF